MRADSLQQPKLALLTNLLAIAKEDIPSSTISVTDSRLSEQKVEMSFNAGRRRDSRAQMGDLTYGNGAIARARKPKSVVAH